MASKSWAFFSSRWGVCPLPWILVGLWLPGAMCYSGSHAVWLPRLCLCCWTLNLKPLSPPKNLADKNGSFWKDNIYLFCVLMCRCVHVYMCVHDVRVYDVCLYVCVPVWRSEGNFWELVLSFHKVDPGYPIHIAHQASRQAPLPSQPSCPHSLFLKHHQKNVNKISQLNKNITLWSF